MADNGDRRTDGAPPRHIHVEDKKANWLLWLLLALGLLALLLFAVTSLMHRNATETAAATASPATATSAVVAETPNASTSALAGYLAGSQPTPRTFTFDALNFDTAKSAIRPADRADVNAVATVLKRYPTAHVRIAGYADTRGSEASNVALGKARADSVKAALVDQGIDGGRIETATGGDADPIDTNATASGRAENRRTELVVTQR